MAKNGDVSQDEVKELTNQFFVTLRAYVARLSSLDEQRSPKSFKFIEELLGVDKKSWSDAYQIEQLIVDLYDERTLEVELKNRLLEADSNLRPTAVAQYVKLAETLKTAPERRPLLARLVNDLQWRYTVQEVKRTYSKEITKDTATASIVTFVCFVVTLVAIGLVTPLRDAADQGHGPVLLWLAGSAGAWGAGFSMLAGLKGRLDAAELDDLKLMRSRWILWSRPLIGVGAAAILSFFIISGLLGGTAFPDFKQAGGTGAGAGVASSAAARLALLVVWCFIAGFSERLVPALLTKTEERASGQPALGSERFKPPTTEGEQGAGGSPAGTSSTPAAPPSGGGATPPAGGP